ncbi:hypothetical protein C8Q70DRAFT_1059229 [Cubamyces menziesii]|uniref:Fungal-type protein kinase domain-containing protein n=1 Tax=Trametes cubensis TaxID=1111947 RepID=A0AAD7TI21_9APHY|nr:hypothetical protein C8Q70DRAFT_1059229 [Cubamyces menziesii]KAJ8462011.1 hypothetical protein ONZ51_g11170 [Trametes cubensis]
MADNLAMLPYDEFMTEFLPPIEGEPNDNFYNHIFDTFPTNGRDLDMYQWFVHSINIAGILGDFSLVVTYSPPGSTDPKKRKPDVGMYRQDTVPPTGGHTNWATIELTIEFKTTEDDAFDDEESDHGHSSSSIRCRDDLSRILGSAGLVFRHQHVTHHFSVIISADCARVGRINHAGLVLSPEFSYKEEPAKLGHFFWRLAHISSEARGRDTTATYVSPSSAEGLAMLAWETKTLPTDDYVRQRFVRSLDQGWAWWKLRVRDGDGHKEFLVAKPAFATTRAVGRATRGYIAYYKSNSDHPFVYLKDCWRIMDSHSELEGDILADLNQHEVTNVPTMLCHGDVGEQRTVSQDIWARLHPTKECHMQAHQHYRLVVNEVGLPLKEFPNGFELVSVLTDCIEAHEEAYTKANIIHRDISVGNILLVPWGIHPEDGRTIYRGLLTDWELSKRIGYNESEARDSNRTGTWQFQSVNALRYPTARIEIADELESFFHVLLYCAMRFLPNTCNDVSLFIHKFFDCDEPIGPMRYTCSLVKTFVMRQGWLETAAGEPIEFLLQPQTPEEAAAAIAARKKTPSLSALLSEPSTSPSVATAYDRRHPIDHIFATLLRWFKARYELMKPSSRTTADLERLQAAAGHLSTHGDILHFLTIMLYSQGWSDKWPLNDKQPDQLNRNSSLDQEKGNQRGKRKDRDDDRLEESQPESKRIRCAASRG